MNICEIGTFFQSTSKMKYLSDATFLEYDALLIDWGALTSGSSQEYYTDYEKRKEQLSEFLFYKKIPIIYFSPLRTEFSAYAGTFRENFNCAEFAPVPKIKVQNESGRMVKVIENTALTELYKKYEEFIEFKTYYTEKHGTVCLETPHTRKILSFYSEEYIFLPQLNNGILKREKEFLEDLLNSAKDVNRSTLEIELPKWTNDFYLPKEKTTESEIMEKQEVIFALTKELAEKEKELKEIRSKKLLFSSSGDILENEIEKVFRELGFDILESEKGRDDLILKYGERVAVVEIKGVSGSAAEKHAAQLEKWSANYFERTGIRPKSILLVNTYRDIPLDQRMEPAFPHQMIKYSTQREHCLITTVDLLVLYFCVLNESEKKETFINSLFDTVGLFKPREDWNNFIELDKQA